LVGRGLLVLPVDQTAGAGGGLSGESPPRHGEDDELNAHADARLDLAEVLALLVVAEGTRRDSRGSQR
jgi:hypothetical protein